jgi:hypothetical protein
MQEDCMYYLYVKTHNKTGLKYLGHTRSKDPYRYKGSGSYWVSHIKKHGNDVSTSILKECTSLEEVSELGLYYSELWNVVSSEEWANLIPEAGEGGWYLIGDRNPQKREDVRLKTSNTLKEHFAENPRSDEWRINHSKWNKSYWTEERRKNHPTDHSRGSVSVTDKYGVGSRISKELYSSIDRTRPIEEWEYVSVSSAESKRRKKLIHP